MVARANPSMGPCKALLMATSQTSPHYECTARAAIVHCDLSVQTRRHPDNVGQHPTCIMHARDASFRAQYSLYVLGCGISKCQQKNLAVLTPAKRNQQRGRTSKGAAKKITHLKTKFHPIFRVLISNALLLLRQTRVFSSFLIRLWKECSFYSKKSGNTVIELRSMGLRFNVISAFLRFSCLPPPLSSLLRDPSLTRRSSRAPRRSPNFLPARSSLLPPAPSSGVIARLQPSLPPEAFAQQY